VRTLGPEVGRDVPIERSVLLIKDMLIPAPGIGMQQADTVIPPMGTLIPTLLCVVSVPGIDIPAMPIVIPASGTVIPAPGLDVPSVTLNVPWLELDEPLMGHDVPAVGVDVSLAGLDGEKAETRV